MLQNNSVLHSFYFVYSQEATKNAFRTVSDETQVLRTKLEAVGSEIAPKVNENFTKINKIVSDTAAALKVQAEAVINDMAKKN